MGASISKNMADGVIRAISTVATENLQSSDIHASQHMNFIVDGALGVDIENDVLTQRITLNARDLQKTLSTTESQQKIFSAIQQEAKSIVSGLNLAQVANAENVTNLVSTAMMNIYNTSRLTCNKTLDQEINYIYKHIDGPFILKDVKLDQIQDIFSSCIQQSAENNKVVQDISQQLEQMSSAKAEGLSSWVIVGIVAVMIGLPIVGGVAIGKTALKFIFPLVLIAAITFIVLYFVKTKSGFKVVPYSSPIDGIDSRCNSELLTVKTGMTVEDAFDECKNNEECKAVYWEKYIHKAPQDVSPNGKNYQAEATSTAKFFKNVSSNCANNIHHNLFNTTQPADFTTTKPASPEDRDAYVDDTTKLWYQYNAHSKSWNQMAVLGDEKDIFLRYTTPPGTPDHEIEHLTPEEDTESPQPTRVESVEYVPGNVWIYYNKRNPTILKIYKYITNDEGENVWKFQVKMTGPGYKNVGGNNMSGFKTEERQTWMLYVGVLAIIIGILGTGITFYLDRKKSE